MIPSAHQPWLHRFAVLTALATLGLVGMGGLVTSHGVGMAVPDWPTSYGYNMFALPISTWSYDDEPGVRHMGPMAQDFSAAFQLGADDRHIFTLDANGVTMASIQALAARTEALARQNEALRRENETMREAVRRIEARLGTEGR